MEYRSLCLAMAALQAGCATDRTGSDSGILDTGALLFRGAFDPDLNFAADPAGASNQIILTVQASNRDDYAPAYSLAIAYHCAPVAKLGQSACRLEARNLRVAPPGGGQFANSIALLDRVKSARTVEELDELLPDAELEWLETDVGACEGAIAALDGVRLADWQPDLHWSLRDDREIMMHPAMIRIRMSGDYTTTRYEGWVLARGVPAAVRQLLATLEPCWKPSTTPRPWTRRARR